MVHLSGWLADWSGWFWPVFFHHLWQSTLFGALVFAATTLLKRGPAHSRYKMWLLASAKFAVPSILFAAPLNRLWKSMSWIFYSPRSPSATSLSDGPGSVFAYLAVPMRELAEPSVIDHPSVRATHFSIYTVLTMVWITGVAVIFAIWLGRRLALSRKLRRATTADSARAADALARARIKLSVARPVKLVLSADIREPGIWGTWRPVLVLPVAFAAELTDAELDATMLHELVHLMRRDNLVSNLNMALCCVLWFHPLVWLLDKRLLADREAACDERALALIEDRNSYLSSILKVSGSGLFSHVAGVSHVNGSNLNRRIKMIMASNLEREQNNRRSNRMISAPRIVLVSSVLTFILFSTGTGLLSRDAAIAQSAAVRTPSTQDRSKGAQAGVVVAGGVTGGVASGVTGGVPGGIPSGVPEGVPGGVPGGIIGGVPGGVPDRLGATSGQAAAGTQQDHSSDFIALPYKKLEGQAAQNERTLTDLLKESPDTDVVPYNLGSGSPFGPISVTARTLGREVLDQAGLAQAISAPEYVAEVTISITNTLDRPLVGIAVMLWTMDRGPKIYDEGANLSIAPGEHYAFTVNCQSGRLLPGGVADLKMALGGAVERGKFFGLLSEDPSHIFSSYTGQDSTATVDGVKPVGFERVNGKLTIRESEGLLSASAIERPLPGYPPLARASGIGGSVVVEVVIEMDGTVESAKAISGDPLLREAAVAAAKRWRWNPTGPSGSPMPLTGKLTFAFTLSDH
jgi:TonB family protein